MKTIFKIVNCKGEISEVRIRIKKIMKKKRVKYISNVKFPAVMLHNQKLPLCIDMLINFPFLRKKKIILFTTL